MNGQRRVPVLLLLSLGLLVSASGSCRKRQPGGHDDDHGHGEKGKGEPERPSLVVTVYENGLELFMEYPALVVGQDSPLVAHFTDARDPLGFKVITRGRVTAHLRHADGSEERFVAEKLLRDGIFKPVVKPSKAGEGTLTLTLEGEQVMGTVSAGKVTVHPDMKSAIAAAPKEEAAAATISFLKEAQWKTRYATAPAETRALEAAVRANGELKAVPGQSAELAAPIAALIPVNTGAPGRVPHLGQSVKKGELLLTLSPTNLASGSTQASVELELSRARAERQLAERDLQRARELFEAKAIPEKQLDAARTAVEVAAARMQAAERERGLYRSAQGGVGAGGGRRGSFELRSPLDGVISFADVTPGAAVEAGTRLLSVVNTSRLWLEARIYEADIPKVERSQSATFSVAGFDEEFVIDGKTGRRVAVGAVVDAATRTVPIVFELVNPEGRLKPGMFARVNVATGDTVRSVAVPESALVDEAGKPAVFVLVDGETFEKRPLRTGIRSGGFVQVLEGVKAGERVVSQGAYEIKLASSTGAIPDHGHQH